MVHVFRIAKFGNSPTISVISRTPLFSLFSYFINKENQRKGNNAFIDIFYSWHCQFIKKKRIVLGRRVNISDLHVCGCDCLYLLVIRSGLTATSSLGTHMLGGFMRDNFLPLFYKIYLSTIDGCESRLPLFTVQNF